MKKKLVRPMPKQSLGKKMLEVLLEIGEAYAHPLETHYQEMKRLRQEFYGHPLKYWEFNQTIRELKRNGYLEIVRKSSQQFIILTQKGALTALLNKLDHPLREQKKWDGKWRLITWDIPEDSRRERNRLRYFVKSMGFYQIQKSVFITPFELPQDAITFLVQSDLIKYIRFFRIDRVDNDRLLKKHFGL